MRLELPARPVRIASFYADKIRALLQISIDNPESRKFTLAQRYSIENLRDDLPQDRRDEIVSDSDGRFSFSIRDEDLDRKKIPAGVWLVGDEGVYIMMNVDMSLPMFRERPVEHAVQCFETDPRNVGRAEQYQQKMVIFGKDDGSVFLSEELVRSFLEGARTISGARILMIDVHDTFIEGVHPAAFSAWKGVMSRSGIPHFFDPDRKGDPVLWGGRNTQQA